LSGAAAFEAVDVALEQARDFFDVGLKSLRVSITGIVSED